MQIWRGKIFQIRIIKNKFCLGGLIFSLWSSSLVHFTNQNIRRTELLIYNFLICLYYLTDYLSHCLQSSFNPIFNLKLYSHKVILFWLDSLIDHLSNVFLIFKIVLLLILHTLSVHKRLFFISINMKQTRKYCICQYTCKNYLLFKR